MRTLGTLEHPEGLPRHVLYLESKSIFDDKVRWVPLGLAAGNDLLVANTDSLLCLRHCEKN